MSLPGLASVTLTPSSALLGPVLGLNLWTFFMEGWMYKARTAFVRSQPPGAITNRQTKHEWEKLQPAETRWKSDNLINLFEQPTQFYSVALTLALLGADGTVDVALAWGYVAARVAHSVVQSTSNHIMTRFKLFILSGGVLLGMTVRAVVLLNGKLDV